MERQIEVVEAAGVMSPWATWLVLLLLGWIGVCCWIAWTQLAKDDR